MSNLPVQSPGRLLATAETPLTQQFLSLTLGDELFAALRDRRCRSPPLAAARPLGPMFQYLPYAPARTPSCRSS